MPLQQKKVEKTLTLMEAAITMVPGTEEEMYSVHNKIIPVAANQPGYLWYAGGPVANSDWTYFSAKFESPEAMDAWYRSPRHAPVQKLGFDKWFATMYIRKWRLPIDGEELGDRILCETTIRAPRPFDEDETRSLGAVVDAQVEQLNAMPFETLTGQFEPQNYQLVGPLQELPSDTPAKYLLLTHWSSAEGVKEWLNSPAHKACRNLGETSTSVFVPLPDEPGSRPYLRADGLQRDWIADPAGAAPGSKAIASPTT